MTRILGRRRFLQGTMAAPLILACSRRDPLARIGMTSVTFRMQFAATRPSGYQNSARELTLLEIPEYFADRFHLHNVELWSAHFADRSPGYLSDLRKRIDRAGSKVINIQIDGPYDLSNTDEAARSQSVDYIRGWMDAAVTLGSGAVRANSGKTGTLEQCVKSYRELAEYGQKIGVVMLDENHGGVAEKEPANQVKMIQTINSPYLRSLPDFGNYPPEIRYEGLKTIMPYAYLISAKTEAFNDKWEHTSFDFDRCMRITVDGGFKGVYSAEYWDRTGHPLDAGKVADWMIEHISEYV